MGAMRRPPLLGVLSVVAVLLALAPLGGARSQTRTGSTGSATGSADPITARTQSAHGLYITGPWVRMHGADEIIRLAQTARMDTVVIDFKDAQGRVHYDTQIAELAPQETGMLGDVRQLNATLHAAGIQTVARIVCFNDPVFAPAHLDRAILDTRTSRRGRAWISWGTGGAWLDPWDRANQDMIVTLSDEAEALGFDEVQLDYIRFPVDDGIRFAQYPDERAGVARGQMMLELLARIDAAIDIPLGVDVFGLTAFWEGDTSGLGQDLELWSRHVDVFTPMLYLNSMRDWQRDDPERARHLVQTGVSRLRTRLGPGPIIRPFLQAFSNGTGGTFGPGFIADQLVGARRGGADGYLFWHPGSSYGVVMRAMQGVARSLSPFPIPADRTTARGG